MSRFIERAGLSPRSEARIGQDMLASPRRKCPVPVEMYSGRLLLPDCAGVKEGLTNLEWVCDKKAYGR